MNEVTQYDKRDRAYQVAEVLKAFSEQLPMGVLFDHVMPLIAQLHYEVGSESLEGWSELSEQLEQLAEHLDRWESIYYELNGVVESFYKVIDKVTIVEE